MLKKRLVGVVTVCKGWAVQSFGYNKLLPLGRVECVVENLDRWGVDEIFLQEIDRSRNQLGPNVDLIKRIARSCISTPILYGGGVGSPGDAVRVVRAGAERVCIDALLFQNPGEVKGISESIGAQAVVASLPMVSTSAQPRLVNYLDPNATDHFESVLKLINDQLVSEVIVIDVANEGSFNGFDLALLNYFQDVEVPLIPFGGITRIDQMKVLLEHESIPAIAIGNSLNYREHSVQRIKNLLTALPIRKPYFHSEGLN